MTDPSSTPLILISAISPRLPWICPLPPAQDTSNVLLPLLSPKKKLHFSLASSQRSAQPRWGLQDTTCPSQRSSYIVIIISWRQLPSLSPVQPKTAGQAFKGREKKVQERKLSRQTPSMIQVTWPKAMVLTDHLREAWGTSKSIWGFMKSNLDPPPPLSRNSPANQ